MVFFTCNHCGESVKKPSVEKHYNTKCRGAPKSISCMDCQKDFQDNYVEHTKCITELEKYSGKDYVPRESANSGAKKQEGWVETVRAVLDSSEYDLSKPTRQAFEMLQKYDNVPRKKAKFLNFVTNSVRIPRKTVEEVWNILEKEQDKLKQAKQKQLEAVKAEKQAKEIDNEPENKKNKLEQNGHVVETEKHGKKKKLNTENSSENLSKENEENDANHNGIDAKLEKKLKKKQKLQENNDENPAVDSNCKNKKAKKHADIGDALNGNAKDADVSVSKKKAKKTGDNIVQENGVEEAAEANVEGKKTKSKYLEETNNHVQHHENGDIIKDKKKKKRTADNEESLVVDTPTKKQKLNGETQSNGKSKIKNEKTQPATNDDDETEAYTFSWDYEFSNVMSKYRDGIDIAKLKKKLLKKYKTKFDAELNERQQLGFEKKFNKKLKKNSLLKVEGDTVKSVS